MPLSDQENHEQPTKRRKKISSTKPFALSQQSAMDTSSRLTKPMKRLSSVEVGGVATKKARSQCSPFSIYDDEESSKFGNVSIALGCS